MPGEGKGRLWASSDPWVNDCPCRLPRSRARRGSLRAYAFGLDPPPAFGGEMAHNIPPAPGPGEAPVFEKRMGELREQLEQRRSPRQRRRDHGVLPEAGSGAAPPAVGEERAAAAAPPASGEAQPPGAEVRERAGAVPVQPENWEEPYVRPPRKRPRKRRADPVPLPQPLTGMRVVALCAAVSALVSAGICLAFGAGDAASAGAALTAVGWSR